MDQRKIDLANWARHQLADLLSEPGIETVLQNLSGDASFRRYFRVSLPQQSFVLVDAPPAQEDSRPFVTIAEQFRQAGLLTPRVIAADFALGFMLLEDFGDQLYLPELQKHRNDTQALNALYYPAIDALLRLQLNQDPTQLPPYDRALLHREMQLFEDWFCRRFLELQVDARISELLATSLRFLEDAALEQTQVAVHRDYHSRNLMLPQRPQNDAPPPPAILDFQDAVAGPYTYDLVSLLRDCYIRWPADYVETLALRYKTLAEQAKIIPSTDRQNFLRHFDLMGLQRHLKVIGIFARLALRDNKTQFLADIPLVIDYFVSVAARYPELQELLQWFEQAVLPLARSKLPMGTS